MPELPEVETITAKLRQILPHQKITQIKVLKDKSFGGDVDHIIGSKITDVSRRAKIIRFHLDNGLSLLTHLKMTGQLIYVDQDRRMGGGHPSADWVNDLPSKHTRIVYDLTGGARLFFNDQRIFGWMKVMTAEQIENQFAQLGPDINSPDLNLDYLVAALVRRRIPIKQAMMDNKVVCGLGNIYVCDALNLSQISPFRPANSLSEHELKTLLANSQQVIARGIELGGTTFDGKYVGVDGFAGGYQKEVVAYGRAGEKCYNCGSLISKEKLGGRGTYYCPNCQR